eukprot:GEZU01019134.1.p1 GENE.GEZU01019134.1~~GEZU01019134.1.p1  ORF type:complete len:255 (-),score=91.06 GEZU01019134.1:106-870(-)
MEDHIDHHYDERESNNINDNNNAAGDCEFLDAYDVVNVQQSSAELERKLAEKEAKRLHYQKEREKMFEQKRLAYQGRTEEEWARIFEKYPTTPDGFMKSFMPYESEEFLKYIDKYGFVVIKFLDEQQREATIKEIFEEINYLNPNQKQKVDRFDPATWDTANWPDKGKFLTKDPTFGPRAFENRTNPTLYKVFCDIFRDEKLWCSMDKWGFMRGTKDLKFVERDEAGNIISEKVEDRPQWRWELLLHTTIQLIT